jgi:hypothetical protein
MVMNDRPDDLDPKDVTELHDPAFHAYVRQRVGMPVTPDEEDFDWTAPAHTQAEQAHQYRLAQARKLLRLYREWKAGQN